MRRRVVAVGLLLGAFLAGALVLAASASAHASVVSSDPLDGSRLKSAPQTVTISFDEQVRLSLGYLHVTNQSGHRVDTGAAFHPGGDGTKIASTLRLGLGDGTYTESYRVISADSHPVAGTVRFVVGTGALSIATGTSGTPPTVDASTGVAFDVARWVSYAGFALLGGLWLLLTVWPQGRDERRARALVWAGWSGAALGALAELLLQGPDAAGSGPSGVLRWSLLDATLHTSYGRFHCARLVLLGVLALLLGSAVQGAERRRARWEDAAWPLLVGVAFTFSATGHPATTSPVWLSEAADVLHLCAMAAWVGGLALLLGALLPRREPAELRSVLPVFSRVAFVAVATIAVTGTYAAWRGIGSLRAIFTTEYGLLVSLKVLLFLGLLALGNVSRQAVQRRLLRLPVAYAMTDTVLAEPPAASVTLHTERMRRSVLVEVVLAALVLAATAVLVDKPRGREALAARARQPVMATANLQAGRTVTVGVSPGEHGDVALTVALSPGSEPTHVAATATQPVAQLGPIPITLTPDGADLYTASGVPLPVAGSWVLTLVVTYSRFDAVSTDVTFRLS
ncbi:MAG: copper resistance CopC/CopD family protein [Jatrophihabitantaceae bacterium]